MSVKVRDPPTCVPILGGTLIGGGAVEVREDEKEGGREMKRLEEGEVILIPLPFRKRVYIYYKNRLVVLTI